MYQALSHQLAHLHSNSTDTQFHSPPPSTTTSRTPSPALSTSPPPAKSKPRGRKPRSPEEKATRDQLRKVSHSAIERRRRERINDKIMHLKALVPTCAGQESPHKLVILQCAIEYIEEMQRCIKGIKVEEEGGLMMLARATCDKRVEGDRAGRRISVGSLLC